MRNTLVLILIDGFGLSAVSAGNAFTAANAPNLHTFLHSCPSTTLSISDDDGCTAEWGCRRIGAGRNGSLTPTPLRGTLGECLSSLALPQTRVCAVSSRSAALDWFNGGQMTPFALETDLLVSDVCAASPVDSALQTAEAVAQAALEALDAGAGVFLTVHLSACAVCAQTGSLPDTVAAVETVDRCLGALRAKCAETGSPALLCATGCGAEQVGTTSVKRNLLPFAVAGADVSLRPGSLADVAPTILAFLGLSCPPEMDGRSLLLP